MLQNLTPSHLVVHRGTTATSPKLSTDAWKKVDATGLSPNGDNPPHYASDDFCNFSGFSPAISGTTALPSTTVPGPSGYGVYLDTATSACSVTQTAVAGGVARLATGATDNHEAWITSGGNTGTIGAISSGGTKRVIFEAKVKFGAVADVNYFVGLTEEGCAAANTIGDTGTLADKDYIGFSVNEGDSDALLFVYKKAGQTAQTLLTYGTALQAGTWYNLAFHIDPDAPEAKRLKVLVNNVEQSTYGTKTQLEAATFPAGEELAFTAGVKNDGATASTMDIDCWAAYFAN